MTIPIVDVVIPWRTDHGERAKIFSWVCDWWTYEASTLNARYVVWTSDSPGRTFNRSMARNLAASDGSAEYMAFVDADTILTNPAGLMEGLRLLMNREAPWVVPYYAYYNLSQESTDEILSIPPRNWAVHDGFYPTYNIEDQYTYEHKILSWAGVLLMRRKDFENVGGYDERFSGWGHEDVAFRVKLDAEVGNHERVGGSAIHFWHPIDHNQTFNSPDELRNRRLFELEYKRKYNWNDERIKSRFSIV